MAEFRLASLLRLRKLEADVAAGELAGANHRAREHEKVVARTRRALADYGAEVSSVEQLRAVASARLAATGMLDELAALQGETAAAVETAGAAFRAANTRTRTLDRLEERWGAEQAAAAASAEQLALDDLSNSRTNGGRA